MNQMSCSFWIDGKPMTKGSWKATRSGHLRPDNERERPWANAVAWCAKAAGMTPTTGPKLVWVTFYFAKPKKPAHAYPSRGDIDKLARSALDAITGIGWIDDSQVVGLVARKEWAGSEGPGARVWVGDASGTHMVAL